MLNCSPQKRKNLQINPYLILRLGERGGGERRKARILKKKFFNKNEKRFWSHFKF
jgi:hypothetical protein